MEYFDNILCVSGSELIISDKNPDGLISLAMWKKLVRDGAKVVRRASFSKSALLEFASLPFKYRELITSRYGNPEAAAASMPFKDRIQPDDEAATFFNAYRLSDGRQLPDKAKKQYTWDAAVLNTIKVIFEETRSARRRSGASMNNFWKNATIAINNCRADIGHNLPSAETPLRRKFQAYAADGYQALISKKYCNDNSRKVSADIEKLLMALYTQPNKPYHTDVYTMYLQFVSGNLPMADAKTGEVFHPESFRYNGKPLEISETTVRNYLNQAFNKVVVDRKRSGGHHFATKVRPHNHRHAPNFSFSKISMDDRDLPRPSHNGKRVKAYYAIDVMSQCYIGYAHSFDKNEALFIDCLRNMFQLIEREDFGMPMQVEVENHLVNKFFDDLYMMFPFVRICNPGNSQEKYAETGIRLKKYGFEKKKQRGIGRFYAKSDAHRVDRDKVNDEFVEKSYSFEQLVADDIKTIMEINNSLHPNQKKYPGKTRWEVLKNNLNPNRPQISKASIYRSIGEKTSTSVVRNQYVTVQYAKYQIPSVQLLARLAPGNNQVEAYYMPDLDGVISEVFLFQNGQFICEASRLETYNTALAERTDKDEDIRKQQNEYIAEFDIHTKHSVKELPKLVMLDQEAEKELEKPVTIVKDTKLPEPSIEEFLNEAADNDWEQEAINDL